MLVRKRQTALVVCVFFDDQPELERIPESKTDLYLSRERD